MLAPAERILFALALLCMAGAAIGLYVERSPSSDTVPAQQVTTQNSGQETAAREPEEEPRRFPLPAGPRKYQEGNP